MKKTPRNLSIHKMIPNMITLTALAAGMTSIKFAIAAKWEHAVIAIMVAAFMDAFDGAAARLLKAQSKLGAELDSFADLVSFGVAPALLIYLWALEGAALDGARWAWPVALVFAMAVTLRLARFNIATEEGDPNDPLHKYFTGVPSPVGAGLCLLPMIVSFQTSEAVQEIVKNPVIVGSWAMVVAAMMVSNIPTFSSKQIRISYKFKIPVLGFFAIVLAGLINDTWPTITLLGAAYLLTLPFGVRHYQKRAAAYAAGQKDVEVEAEENEE